MKNTIERGDPRESIQRRGRADAQRNLDLLLGAALEVFASSGVDAPVRDIATKAGVGIGTLYRHFPSRSDLVAAVFRREIDACADMAAPLAAGYEPYAALAKWIECYVAFLATKKGLATALHSGEAAYEPLPAHRKRRLVPALQGLLDAAAAAGTGRTEVDAEDLLNAVGCICMSSEQGERTARMVGILVEGLRGPIPKSIPA